MHVSLVSVRRLQHMSGVHPRFVSSVAQGEESANNTQPQFAVTVVDAHEGLRQQYASLKGLDCFLAAYQFRDTSALRLMEDTFAYVMISAFMRELKASSPLLQDLAVAGLFF